MDDGWTWQVEDLECWQKGRYWTNENSIARTTARAGEATNMKDVWREVQSDCRVYVTTITNGTYRKLNSNNRKRNLLVATAPFWNRQPTLLLVMLQLYSFGPAATAGRTNQAWSKAFRNRIMQCYNRQQRKLGCHGQSHSLLLSRRRLTIQLM